jgi:hypothetical protein
MAASQPVAEADAAREPSPCNSVRPLQLGSGGSQLGLQRSKAQSTAVVLGAGTSGLQAARALMQAGFEVRLSSAARRAAGGLCALAPKLLPYASFPAAAYERASWPRASQVVLLDSGPDIGGCWATCRSDVELQCG